MATLAQVRDAVKTTLEALVPDVVVYPRFASVVNPPAVVVVPAETDYAVTMGRSTMRWDLDLYVLASSEDDGLAQWELDDLVDIDGAKSIVKALFGEDLGLTDTHAHVASMRAYGSTFEAAGCPHIGAILRLAVITKGAS